ncbi:MAG: hypothetical protein OXF95_03235 [Rhodobacteraceae bacterium]|nr:hypothetical protein [Paracoccaceae bacterium]
MPAPLLIPALLAGGTLVPHAAGGLIVTGGSLATGASGYVAGTFLSTAAISNLIGAGLFSSGAITGALGVLIGSSLIGTSGFLGTGIGATGLTGIGISLGLVATTPIWIPVATAAGGLAVFGATGYLAYDEVKRRRLEDSINKKIKSQKIGEEIEFTEEEAEYIENRLKRAIDKKLREVFENMLELEKVQSASIGNEAVFTKEEAEFLEKLLKRTVDKEGSRIFESILEKVKLAGRIVEMPKMAYEWISRNILEIFKSTPQGEEVELTEKETRYLEDQLKRVTDKDRRRLSKSVLAKLESIPIGNVNLFTEEELEMLKYLLRYCEKEAKLVEDQLKHEDSGKGMKEDK